MVYTIELQPENDKHFHGKVIFDIEFWLNEYHDKNRGELWYTECKITVVPEGVVPLARSVENPDELIKDMDHIRKYRVWLNESGETYNRILPMEEASKRMSEYHHPELKKRIEEFCKKYNLIYNVD